MAKGRTRSRMELREQYDAAEARGKAEGGDAEQVVADAAEDDAGVAKPKKKKAATKKAPGEAKPRKTKAKAIERKRVVWVVYDNSHKEIARFPYTHARRPTRRPSR